MLKGYLHSESMDKKKVPFDFTDWEFYTDSRVRLRVSFLFSSTSTDFLLLFFLFPRRLLNSSTDSTVESSLARSSNRFRGDSDTGNGRSDRRVSCSFFLLLLFFFLSFLVV